MDDHRIDIGNIESCLNDRRRHQHINITIDEIKHNLLKLMLLHLSMCKCHVRFRHKARDLVRNILDIIDAVVHIIHLSLSGQFPHDCLPYHFLIVFHNIGLDRLTLSGCFLKHAHITDTDKTHMKCPRNRCSSQCQHIHILFHLLDFLLMAHAEPLFLIDDQKSKILVFDIL